MNLVTDNYIAGGYWKIGWMVKGLEDEGSGDEGSGDEGSGDEYDGVVTVEPAGDLWPHQVKSWQYKSQPDPFLTVTGKIISNTLYVLLILKFYQLQREPQNILRTSQ